MSAGTEKLLRGRSSLFTHLLTAIHWNPYE
jgi:hypothetical protein